MLATNMLLSSAAASSAFSTSTAAARLHSIHSAPPNAKILHLVRHAEGTHNVSPDYKTPAHWDAPLTKTGEQQCRSLAESLNVKMTSSSSSSSSPLKLDCVVCSPMTRTLQTAELCFGRYYNGGGIPFVAHEEWRETVNFLCDSRRPISRLKEQFSLVDFQPLVEENDPIWSHYEAKFGPHHAYEELRESDDAEGLEKRARQAWRCIAARPEKHIAVVSHSALFMHMFTPQHMALEGLVDYQDEGVRELLGTRFENCEMRSVAFQPL